MFSTNIHALLQHSSKVLEVALNLDPGTARIEAQCLLQAVLQVNRAHLLAHPEQQLSDEQQTRYDAFFERRLHGEPIAYLLGTREFYGLDFKVTPATLIPRPETELLVELALQRIRTVTGHKFRVLDLGTGSGAIALSIAHARPEVEVIAVDASTAALAVAHFNMQHLKLNNVQLMHSDWFNALDNQRFDLIVANPPYIAANDKHLSQGDVRFEPLSALASGEDGLNDIRAIVTQAPQHLNENGWLLMEHGYDQAAQVRTLLQQVGFNGVGSSCDLSGIERVTGGYSTLSHKP